MAQGVPDDIVRVRVPAKINLALRVGPRRDDGYHPLATIYQAVSLFDEITVHPAMPGEFSLVLDAGADDRPLDVPTGDDNLALRAARLLAGQIDDDSLGARIVLRKSIPVAAGLAGGSADAAGTLLALTELWDVDLDPDELSELAAQLGSDVPFALLGGTAVGTGRGEALVPALTRGTYHYVLAVAFGGLSTPQVYGRFDELVGQPAVPEVSRDVLHALAAADPAALAGALSNDLAVAAFDPRPDLSDTLATGLDAGALAGLVCGSGPTLLFLAADEASAVDLSNRLARSGTCAGVRRVSGPVPGARLLG